MLLFCWFSMRFLFFYFFIWQWILFLFVVSSFWSCNHLWLLELYASFASLASFLFFFSPFAFLRILTEFLAWANSFLVASLVVLYDSYYKSNFSFDIILSFNLLSLFFFSLYSFSSYCYSLFMLLEEPYRFRFMLFFFDGLGILHFWLPFALLAWRLDSGRTIGPEAAPVSQRQRVLLACFLG